MLKSFICTIDVDSKMMLADILSICYGIADKDVRDLSIEEIAGEELYQAMRKFEKSKYDVIASHLGKKGLIDLIESRNKIAEAIDETNLITDPKVQDAIKEYYDIPLSYSDELTTDLTALNEEYKETVEQIAQKYTEFFNKAKMGIEGFIERKSK